MANRLAREPAPTCCCTPTIRSTGTPGATEAFARARREDKPIFLSVGYSTCYWCHVMERESFSDPAIARADERGVRQHQGRPRGAPRPRRDLHAGDAGPHRAGRLAELGLPDARPQAVLRRHLLSARRRARAARLPARAQGPAPRRGATAARSCRSRPRTGAGDPAAPRRPARRQLCPALGGPGAPADASRRSPPRFDPTWGGFGGRRSSRRRRTSLPARRAPRREPDAGARCSPPRSTRWRAAGSTTSSPAASTATRPTRVAGAALREDALRQRLRCSGSTPASTLAEGSPGARGSRAQTADVPGARDDLRPRAPSGAPSTPRPAATRGPSTSGARRARGRARAPRTAGLPGAALGFDGEPFFEGDRYVPPCRGRSPCRRAAAAHSRGAARRDRAGRARLLAARGAARGRRPTTRSSPTGTGSRSPASRRRGGARRAAPVERAAARRASCCAMRVPRRADAGTLLHSWRAGGGGAGPPHRLRLPGDAACSRCTRRPARDAGSTKRSRLTAEQERRLPTRTEAATSRPAPTRPAGARQGDLRRRRRVGQRRRRAQLGGARRLTGDAVPPPARGGDAAAPSRPG